jgi:uncharacterized protein (TIGR03000 family)
MYSVVLMVAMTNGVDLPDCHRRQHGCHGCQGGCYGGSCYGGCYGGSCYGGSCYGGSCHGCHGGCYGSSCHGCHGGCYGASCYGGGCHGCWGGAPAHAAPAPLPAPKATTPPPKTGSLSNNSATIVVNLPAEAKLSIGDAPTMSTSSRRVFTSPELPVGKELYYTLTSEMTVGGQRMSVSKQVPVRAGETTQVTLDFKEASVARR